MVTFSCQASALVVQKCPLDSNATIEFQQKLDSTADVSCELFSLRETRPFYLHGKIDQSALLSNQHGRFMVTTERPGDVFKAILSIQEVQEEDRGVYVLSLRERKSGKVTDHIKDAYVDVILPMGEARCSVQESPYSSSLQEVHCNATVGSERGGIICYRDSGKAPYLSLDDQGSEVMSAVFWLDDVSSINCCSFEKGEETDPENCSDFTYRPYQNLTDIAVTAPPTTKSVNDNFRNSSHHTPTPDENKQVVYSTPTSTSAPAEIDQERKVASTCSIGYNLQSVYALCVLVSLLLTNVFTGCLVASKAMAGNSCGCRKMKVQPERPFAPIVMTRSHHQADSRDSLVDDVMYKDHVMKSSEKLMMA